MSDRVPCRFKVMNGDDDASPWIAVEWPQRGQNVRADGFLALDLPGGTDLTQAEQIASLLNEMIVSLSYHKLD